MKRILTGSDVKSELREILQCSPESHPRTSTRTPRTISYAAVPSARNVRWLLPLNNRRCTRNGLSIYTPFAARARFMKAGLTLISNFPSLWPSVRDHVTLNSFEYLVPLERLTHEFTGIHHPVFCFAIGTAGKYRKLSGQVMDLQGNVGGFLKISLTDDARGRVEREAKVLQELAAADVLAGQIPRVLYAGNWSNKFLLLTTAAPLKRSSLRLRRTHFDFLQSLHNYQARMVPSKMVSEAVAHRWQSLQPTQPLTRSRVVCTALAQAQAILAGKTLQCGFAHGDFTPWNLRACGSEGQGIFAFDWEAARADVPWDWDAFHFQVQSEGLLGKEALSQAKLDVTQRASLLLFLVNSICDSIDEDLDGTSRHDLQYKSAILLRETRKTQEAVA